MTVSITVTVDGPSTVKVRSEAKHGLTANTVRGDPDGALVMQTFNLPRGGKVTVGPEVEDNPDE